MMYNCISSVVFPTNMCFVTSVCSSSASWECIVSFGIVWPERYLASWKLKTSRSVLQNQLDNPVIF